ncbi:nose resistant to fluoxetine protein 6 [Aplysia californica]|uniref:Nose resistant to fluoxetine protein 6 n=1 Tax=Aplysia californica TaxID=6500 RepID=A0ABM0K7X8_APLCA|nr:nose resistant to fluoxetine protein 6 [Aplysia californica]
MIGALMMAGTVVDVIFVQWPAWEVERVKSRGFTHEESTPCEGPGPQQLGQDKQAGQEDQAGETSALWGRPKTKSYAPPSPFWEILQQVLLSFSVYSNAQKVLSTEEAPGTIGCIHGLRFFSMSWLVINHLYLMFVGYLANPQSLFAAADHWTFDIVTNSTIAVDTFFTLGLTPPYMLSLVFFTGFLKFFGSGETWFNTMPIDEENCKKYAWTNLLYINNLVHSENICMPPSWYLANDMQFYLVSPLLL